jgi:hypothetical protein
MTNTMLDAALRYAKRGWPVFPCKPHGKTPLTEHGFEDATIDVPQIGLWWVRWPDANVAIATGEPGPDVVDFDIKNGVDGEEAYHALVKAAMLRGCHTLIITPSGGAHVYFAGTEQHNGSLAKVGVDFRSKGGYVLAPPSHVVEYDDAGEVTYADYYVLCKQRQQTGTPIEWQKVKDILVPPPAPRVPVTPGREASPSARISGALRAMGEAQPGERNHMLYWAAKRLVECDGTVTDFTDLYSVAERVGLTHDEIDKTMRSAQR